MEENIFEKALRLKVRFEYKGYIGVEDLWDLSLKELNSIYGQLVKVSRESNEDSLLETKNRENTINSLKIEIVRSIFNEKDKEIKDRKLSVEKKEKKERLMQVLERKQNLELESLSAEDIKKMIDEI